MILRVLAKGFPPVGFPRVRPRVGTIHSANRSAAKGVLYYDNDDDENDDHFNGFMFWGMDYIAYGVL